MKDTVELGLRCPFKEEDVAALSLSDSDDWMSAQLEVRGDRDLVRLYRRGALVKVHPRRRRGERATDPDDYPPEKTA